MPVNDTFKSINPTCFHNMTNPVAIVIIRKQHDRQYFIQYKKPLYIYQT
jgi:hypothetical protein